DQGDAAGRDPKRQQPKQQQRTASGSLHQNYESGGAEPRQQENDADDDEQDCERSAEAFRRRGGRAGRHARDAPRAARARLRASTIRATPAAAIAKQIAHSTMIACMIGSLVTLFRSVSMPTANTSEQRPGNIRTHPMMIIAICPPE